MFFVNLSFHWQIIFAATSFEPSVSNGAVTEVVERRREEQAQKFINKVQIWESMKGNERSKGMEEKTCT